MTTVIIITYNINNNTTITGKTLVVQMSERSKVIKVTILASNCMPANQKNSVGAKETCKQLTIES